MIDVYLWELERLVVKSQPGARGQQVSSYQMQYW